MNILRNIVNSPFVSTSPHAATAMGVAAAAVVVGTRENSIGNVALATLAGIVGFLSTQIKGCT